MSKEFLKMQKLAGLITENQYKGTLTEVESDLITLLYSLRNSINNDDKEQSMGMINQLLSIARDMEDAQLTEIEGDPDDYYGYNEPIDPNDYADGYDDDDEDDSKKTYGIEKDSSPYDFGPYTYEEAKVIAAKLSAKNPRNFFQPKPLTNMEDDLPAIDRMGMPGRSTKGMSSGDLGDY